MSFNTFGKIFCFTTWGESHGPAIGCVVDGCPPNIALSEKDIQIDMDRRRPGKSKFTSQRKESDKVEILSGVFQGKTTGTPISMIIYNQDARSRDYETIKNKFRPGHADYTYFKKYGIRDYRGGGRQSARETASRVAAGAIAKKVLQNKIGKKFKVIGAVTQLGLLGCNVKNWKDKEIQKNPFFCPDKSVIKLWEKYLLGVRKSGSSCGAIIEIRASGIPIGLGAPIYSKLDADIAAALMSINAVKGVNIGSGMYSALLSGLENSDEIRQKGKKTLFKSNNAGGIEGGMSNAQPIVVRMVMKPIPTLIKPLQSVDIKTKKSKEAHKERTDSCAVPAASIIAESMLCFAIADALLEKFGGDSVDQLKAHMQATAKY